MNRSIAVAATIGLALSVAVTHARAATFLVDSVLDQQDAIPGDGACKSVEDSFCTLRAAITEANALPGPDLILLPAGSYTITLVAANEDNNLGGDFDINSDIGIKGAGAAATIIQAAATAGVATERVFHVRFAAPEMSTALVDLTIRHGRYTAAANTVGAGVRIDGGAVDTTLQNVVIANNYNGTRGGGLAISNATGSVTTLIDSTVEDNSAGGTAASTSLGGGIFLDTPAATLNINSSTITGNVVSNTSTTVFPFGGGIWSGGNLNITNSTISDNTATSSSGSQAYGGGIHIASGTTTILGSTISGNVATVTGVGGGAAYAGGINNQEATLIFTNSVVSENTTGRFHAGIRTSAGIVAATTTITNSVISDNTAVSAGGGVINISNGPATATTNINGSTVSGNAVTLVSGFAGGLQNQSSSSGQAVTNVINSTISGNMSASGAGALNSGSNATINFNYATIANNVATTDGGGLLRALTGAITLKNSIVADNLAPSGPDISGTITSQDYNHIENVLGGTFIALGGDVVGIDPQLAALANNGGATLTHLPAPTSPAVNTMPFGTSDCGMAVTTSQNGNTRPKELRCEKGSVEVLESSLFQDGFDGLVTVGAQLVG